jgi:hypothetical protein
MGQSDVYQLVGESYCVSLGVGGKNRLFIYTFEVMT